MSGDLCSARDMKLHLVALRHGLCLMESHCVTGHPTCFIPVRAELHLIFYVCYLQQLSPTVYKLFHISPTLK